MVYKEMCIYVFKYTLSKCRSIYSKYYSIKNGSYICNMFIVFCLLFGDELEIQTMH